MALLAGNGPGFAILGVGIAAKRVGAVGVRAGLVQRVLADGGLRPLTAEIVNLPQRTHLT